MEEIWKDIDGYDGKYKVSNLGNVSSTKRGKFKLMKFDKTRLGYSRVVLYNDSSAKRIFVHRLVAEAFVPNPNGYPYVNHKDENPTNNKADNLEWCTTSYNINYGTRNQKVSKASRPIKQMTLDGFVLATFCSANYAAKVLNLDCSILYKCLKGKTKTAYTYKWEYIDNIYGDFAQ